jgi:hypothetical protein
MGTIETSHSRLVLLVFLLLLPCCAAVATPQQNGREKHHTQEGTHSLGVTTPQSKPASDETQSAKNAPTRRLQNARIDAIDSNHASVTITDWPAGANGQSLCNGEVMTLVVAPDLRPELNHFKNGDHLRIDTDGKNALSLGVRTLEVDPDTRFEVLAISLAGFFLLATLLTWGKPLKLIEGLDHRYSNSQFQIAIWFWVVMATYLAVVYLRVAQVGWEFFGLVSIPQNLLLLSGMSALTFGAARAITTTKTNAAQAAGQTNPKAGGQPNLWTDLVKNDVGNVDIGDFQMLVVTLVAVGMYLILIFHFLRTIEARASVYLPDLDSTILASFGLGQGAYLTKKAAGNAGTS